MKEERQQTRKKTGEKRKTEGKQEWKQTNKQGRKQTRKKERKQASKIRKKANKHARKKKERNEASKNERKETNKKKRKKAIWSPSWCELKALKFLLLQKKKQNEKNLTEWTLPACKAFSKSALKAVKLDTDMFYFNCLTVAAASWPSTIADISFFHYKKAWLTAIIHEVAVVLEIVVLILTITAGNICPNNNNSYCHSRDDDAQRNNVKLVQQISNLTSRHM